MTPNQPQASRIDNNHPGATTYWRSGRVFHRLEPAAEPPPIPCVGAFSAPSVPPCGITAAAAEPELGVEVPGVTALAAGGDVSDAAGAEVLPEPDDVVVAAWLALADVAGAEVWWRRRVVDADRWDTDAR